MLLSVWLLDASLRDIYIYIFFFINIEYWNAGHTQLRNTSCNPSFDPYNLLEEKLQDADAPNLAEAPVQAPNTRDCWYVDWWTFGPGSWVKQTKKQIMIRSKGCWGPRPRPIFFLCQGMELEIQLRRLFIHSHTRIPAQAEQKTQSKLEEKEIL